MANAELFKSTNFNISAVALFAGIQCSIPAQNKTQVGSFDQFQYAGINNGVLEIHSTGIENSRDWSSLTYVQRDTTEIEKIVGALRSYILFHDNWDGEGAKAPSESSIKQVVNFVRSIPDTLYFPEPMLNANGRPGLYWKERDLYGDIEFLENSKIAYYIEKYGDKHKGIINLNDKNIPPIFAILLSRK